MMLAVTYYLWVMVTLTVKVTTAHEAAKEGQRAMRTYSAGTRHVGRRDRQRYRHTGARRATLKSQSRVLQVHHLLNHTCRVGRSIICCLHI